MHILQGSDRSRRRHRTDARRRSGSHAGLRQFLHFGRDAFRRRQRSPQQCFDAAGRHSAFPDARGAGDRSVGLLHLGRGQGMSESRKIGDRTLPRQQSNWDARAAANFICGGAGGGLLFATALASGRGDDLRPLVVVALALVGIGLLAVWLEIGRPWRALNVYLHAATSWMTREAMMAPLLFASGAAAVLFN